MLHLTEGLIIFADGELPEPSLHCLLDHGLHPVVYNTFTITECEFGRFPFARAGITTVIACAIFAFIFFQLELAQVGWVNLT